MEFLVYIKIYKYINFCVILFKMDCVTEYFNITFVGGFMVQYTKHVLCEVEYCLL
jgi:hypothetical protein